MLLYTKSSTDQESEKVNLGHVIEDIKVLSQLTSRIRLYGMACQQTELVFKAIEYLRLSSDMQVIVTLWVDHDKVTWEKQKRAFWDLIDHDMTLKTDNSKKNNQGPVTVSRVASRITRSLCRE